ncbi:hypothetical protein M8J76_013688 [Diaphorina citri]|nr:hypothetical protein M8J75_002505 [Diaphorina citri]KAI5745721.1 hypothetical protein M8J76_013688 [Diaphorina citri]
MESMNAMGILQILLRKFPTQAYICYQWHVLFQTRLLGFPLFIWLCVCLHTACYLLVTLLYILFYSSLSLLDSEPNLLTLTTQWTVLYLLSFRKLCSFLRWQHVHEGENLVRDITTFQATLMFIIFGCNILWSLFAECLTLFGVDSLTLTCLNVFVLWAGFERSRLGPSLDDGFPKTGPRPDPSCLYLKKKPKAVTCIGLRFYEFED